MRLTFTLFCLIALSYFANATRWTVSNSSARPAQFTQPQAAVDAAQAGDTILILNNSAQYQAITVNKQNLVFIGEGYDYSRYVVSRINFTQSTEGIVIKDLSIGNFSFNNNLQLKDLVIDNCFINNFSWGNSVVLENFSLSNSVINSYFTVSIYPRIRSGIIYGNALSFFTIQDSDNVIFTNNIIGNRNTLNSSTYRQANLRLINSSSIILSYNIFIPNWNSQTAISFISGTSQITVTDNIFYEITVGSCASCDFSNNLTTSTTVSGVDTTKNIVGQDPQFLVNPPNSNVEQRLWENYDFRLSETSPAKGFATDGGEIGIFGGSTPMIFPYLFGISSLPRVTEFRILNPLVGQEDVLEIEVEATSSKF